MKDNEDIEEREVGSWPQAELAVRRLVDSFLRGCPQDHRDWVFNDGFLAYLDAEIVRRVPIEHPAAYGVTIARRLCSNHLTRHHDERLRPEGTTLRGEAHAVIVDIDSVILVKDALNALKQHNLLEHRAVVMRFVEDCPLADIALQLGYGEGSSGTSRAWRVIRRGLLFMRTWIEGN